MNKNPLTVSLIASKTANTGQLVNLENFCSELGRPVNMPLKDRKDRKLEIEDIFHYQKIIGALTETDRLMKEIDKIEVEE